MWIFDYLIEWPAKQGGYIVGGVLHIGYTLGVFAAVIYTAAFIYQRVRTPILNVIGAGIVAVWLALVLVEAERFIALGMLQAVEYTRDIVE